MKPPLHQCTRCGEHEHEPTATCGGKSRHQRRMQTLLAPKCTRCQNCATQGESDGLCGACREHAETERERVADVRRTQRFFDEHGDKITRFALYGVEEFVTLEDLYVHFKVRFLNETQRDG